MRRAVTLVLALAAIAVSIALYTTVMARLGSGAPPLMATTADQADAIVVIKSTREMHLMRGGEALQSYPISLGATPQGHKSREGDERTPEGTYEIDWRNPNSVAHLSLHISYPNAADRAANPDDPGGDIMIHGLPNRWGLLGRLHLAWDWTNGCIAVTNAQMRDIWARVPNGTPIIIKDI